MLDFVQPLMFSSLHTGDYKRGAILEGASARVYPSLVHLPFKNPRNLLPTATLFSVFVLGAEQLMREGT